MRVFEKILCPIDFSETSSNALLWANYFARRYGSSIVVMHSLEMNAYGGPVSVDYGDTVSKVQNKMKEFLAPFSEPFETIITTQSAAIEIANTTTKTGATMIIMGTHGFRGISHKLIGSITEELVRHSNKPIITISPYCSAPPNHAKTRILLPLEHLDVLADSYKVFDQIVQETQSSLSLLHVVGYKEPAFATKSELIPFNTFTLEAEQTNVALMQLGKAMVGRDESLETIVDFGDIAEGILKQANTGRYGYILMGAKKENFLVRFFDSVVYPVLCESPIPVITVKTQ